MLLLWNEYRKESHRFLFASIVAFLFLSGFLIYKFWVLQIHVGVMPQVVLVTVFLFLFTHFIWEMYRQIKIWRKGQYRLLPISEAKFYFSNVLFGWITATILMICYYICLVYLVFLLDKQVNMTDFQEYWKYLLAASYFFLSASIYLQSVYLLSSFISAKVPNRLQKNSKVFLFFLVISAEITLSEQLLNGYRKIAFINSHQFKITLGYVPFYLEDPLVDLLLLVTSSAVTIFILKKYIEAERR